MRVLLVGLLVVLGGCSALPAEGPAIGTMDGAPLTHCSRVVERHGGSINDISHLELGTDERSLSASWRGGDQWYPVSIPGVLFDDGTERPCTVTVDVGIGAWEVSARCGDDRISARATSCY